MVVQKDRFSFSANSEKVRRKRQLLKTQFFDFSEQAQKSEEETFAIQTDMFETLFAKEKRVRRNSQS